MQKRQVQIQRLRLHHLFRSERITDSNCFLWLSYDWEVVRYYLDSFFLGGHRGFELDKQIMVKKIRMISAVGFMLGIFIACNRNYNFWYRYIHDIVGFFYLEY